ncbi:ABC transporter substrate-binding protein [Nonomuraea zeae]|uniref:ABC transporter substrate-binding protein n=1 Tax=Nonomuraea zeae TaxID=1642303 RepID=A0A5S4GFM5_9ACTN|nr:ABC transporter substrate-binding protein [Nonomuraea zeae]TMR31776.1 ABC transporter substrate-binding protein [Nonomuraea zeae]
MRVKLVVAGVALATLAACSGGGVPLTAGSTAPTAPASGASASKAAGDTMVNVVGGTGQFNENLNPLVQGTPNLMGTWGMIYETLMFFNQSKSGDVQPLLATKYEFGDEGKSLTFTLREGVKWNDGQPFTADDVAFNFLYRRDKKDLNAAGTNIVDAQVLSPTQVKITFSERMYTKLWDVAGNSYMVPKHVWEKIDKPSKETNLKPVGTGPFMMGEFTPQSYTLVKNPQHWDTGKPKIAGLRFWSFNNNDASLQALVAGQIDWGAMFMADPDKQFVAKDPAHNTYKNESHLYITNLVPNLTKAPTNDLAVRQAINLALDRDKIIDLAFAGLGKPVSPLGVVLPLFQDYVSPKHAALKLDYNQEKARQTLEAAGYAKDGDGYYAKDGKRVSLTCHLVSGWTDYISAAQVIKQQLKEVGIEFRAKEVSFNAFTDIQQKGDFQLLMWNAWGGPHPFYMYDNILNSKNVPPARQNIARYKNPAVDDALALIASTPPEQADTIKQAIYTIQDAVVADLPYIPVQQSSSLAEFRTTNATGWPSEQNPYALGLPFSHPDNGIVAKNLEPAQ